MSLAIGQTLDDRYLIEAHIGSGGMARVFRAKNQRTGKAVAVKEIYLPENNQADTIRGWLRREIKALMVLDHPNVVQLIDHGETADGTPWVVTELLDGKDLEDSVQHTGPMPDAAVIDVALQALSAFKTAHDLSIVHRDIKPGNIYLCTGGRVVVLDFGLARAVSGDVSATLAEGFGTKIMGTPQYWSPEQIRGVTLDVRSDIFSLGGTFYYLLAGKPPFVGTTPFEIASQIMMKKRVPLAQAAPKASLELVALIESMLEEDAAARPTTTELLRKVEALAARMPNTRPALLQFLTKRTSAPLLPEAEPDLVQTGITALTTPAPRVEEHTVTNVKNVDATNIVTIDSQTRVVTAEAKPAAAKKRSLWPIAMVGAALVAAGAFAFSRPAPLPPVIPPSEVTVAVKAPETALPPPSAPPEVPPPMHQEEPPPEIKPQPKPPVVVEPQGTGTLSCVLTQWAEVVVDGQSYGKKQIGAKLTLPSGKHEVVFKNANFADRKTTVVIRANKETPVKLDFKNALP